MHKIKCLETGYVYICSPHSRVFMFSDGTTRGQARQGTRTVSNQLDATFVATTAALTASLFLCADEHAKQIFVEVKIQTSEDLFQKCSLV